MTFKVLVRILYLLVVWIFWLAWFIILYFLYLWLIIWCTWPFFGCGLTCILRLPARVHRPFSRLKKKQMSRTFERKPWLWRSLTRDVQFSVYLSLPPVAAIQGRFGGWWLGGVPSVHSIENLFSEIRIQYCTLELLSTSTRHSKLWNCVPGRAIKINKRMMGIVSLT